MHLVGALLAVLGAWLLAALPVAVLTGRFLRAGTGRPSTRDGRPLAHDSLDSSAA